MSDMALLRRALVVAAAAAVSLTGQVPTADAQEPPADRVHVSQPILLSDMSLPWIEGLDRWVSLSWTSQADLDDFSVTVVPSSADVAVAYEDPSLGHAELVGGSELSANEIDATMFFLDPGADAGEAFDLELIVSWRLDGELQTGTQTIHVEQRTPGDGPFLLLTDSARVPALGDGARNWVSLSFLGLRDDIRDFSVSVQGELPVYYPQRSFTSLHHDAVLMEDERDVARFWLDPSNIEPGDYELDIVVTYTIDGDGPQQLHAPLHVLVD
ncbi:MAG: hypothetical protein R2710_09310 [Acidimicrobiales bacterium]